jgi:hypothetical protein
MQLIPTSCYFLYQYHLSTALKHRHDVIFHYVLLLVRLSFIPMYNTSKNIGEKLIDVNETPVLFPVLVFVQWTVFVELDTNRPMSERMKYSTDTVSMHLIDTYKGIHLFGIIFFAVSILRFVISNSFFSVMCLFLLWHILSLSNISAIMVRATSSCNLCLRTTSQIVPAVFSLLDGVQTGGLAF